MASGRGNGSMGECIGDCSIGPPKADLDTRIWVQMAYIFLPVNYVTYGAFRSQ